IFYIHKFPNSRDNSLNHPIDPKLLKPNQSTSYWTFLIGGYSESYISYYINNDRQKPAKDQIFSNIDFLESIKKLDDVTDKTRDYLFDYSKENKYNLIIIKTFDHYGLNIYDHLNELEKHTIIKNFEHFYKE